MKKRIAPLIPLTFLCPALGVAGNLPAGPDYSNGPINGTVDGWSINAAGYVVSDSFDFQGGIIGGFQFGVWEFPSDTVQSVQWSITSAENGGTVYGSGISSGRDLVFDQFISTNQFGYDIDKITVVDLDIVAGGTLWLNLQNVSAGNGDPVYWDENSGVGCQSPGCPSSASENAVGTIPSEAFTVNSRTAAPETSSILLFGSGLGLVGVLRRKLL
jgi:hypothetical protein